MKMGVPVVASSGGAIPEVVGDAAITVSPNDDGALASAINSVLVDQELALELRARGKARASMFTWEACAGGLATLYIDAVSANR